MLDLRLQLFVALAVLSGIVCFETRGFDQLHHMRLQRPDWPCDILKPCVEVVDLLPGAVLVEGPGLGALLALLAKLLDGDPVLGGCALVVLEKLLFPTLAAEYLADGLTELVDLVLQSVQAGFLPPPRIIVTQGTRTRLGLCITSQTAHRALFSMRPSLDLSPLANDAALPSSSARIATTLAASAGGSYPPSRNATTRPSAWSLATPTTWRARLAKPCSVTSMPAR